MKRTTCYFAACCIALGVQGAWAADAPAPAQHGDMAAKIFEKMDADGDGVVTKKEFDAFSNQRFNDLDANHDGKITRQELDADREQHMAKMREQMHEQMKRRFDEADANHDGALNKEEAQKMPHVAEHFDEIDTNHDGKVTPEELRAAMMGMRQQQQGK